MNHIRAAQGNRAAFAPLYDANVHLVWNYALARLRDEHRAADATSTTFVKAMAALPRFNPEMRGEQTTFRSWLMTIALAMVNQPTQADSDMSLATDTGLPGDIYVLHDDGSGAWIQLPDDVQGTGILLSPDASVIAVFDQRFGSTGGDDGQALSVAFVSTTDGSVLSRFDGHMEFDNFYGLWTPDGALVFPAGRDLMRMSAVSGSEPEVVYSHDVNMTSIRRTGNPDVVVLSTRRDHGSDATPTAADRDANVSINLSNGTAQEFQGMEMSSIWAAMYSQQELAPAPVVLMYDWAGTGPGTVEVRAIDPTSGEIIHSFEAANPNDLTVGAASGKNQMGVSEDGMVLVIGNGQQLIVINGKGETPSVATLPMDTAMGMAQGTITVSADGNLVGLSTQSESRDRFLIDFSTPEPIVTKIETEGFSPVSHITFVDPMD